MTDAKLPPGHERLAELIIHVSWKSLIDPDFSMAKLKAILFFADFIAFKKTGKSITGEQYVMEGGIEYH